MAKEIIYRTPASTLVEGWTIVRDDNRRVKVEKVYPVGDCIFVRDDSGTMGAHYSPEHLFIVVSDN